MYWKNRTESYKMEKNRCSEIGGEKVRSVGGGKKISLGAFSGKVFKLINKVRLIVIAEGKGHICPIVMGCGLYALINLLEPDVAAQVFRRHTDLLFEFARKMATAQTQLVGKLLDGNAAFATFNGLDGFLGNDVLPEIGFQTAGQVCIDGLDAGLCCFAVVVNVFDECAPLGPPDIIRVGVLVDHLVGGVFKEGVAAAGVKADPEQIYGTGCPDPHRTAHRSRNAACGYVLYPAVAVDDFNGIRHIECEFKSFCQ